jgi:hypothetical protein
MRGDEVDTDADDVLLKKIEEDGSGGGGGGTRLNESRENIG